jgi:hypothetical protein
VLTFKPSSFEGNARSLHMPSKLDMSRDDERLSCLGRGQNHGRECQWCSILAIMALMAILAILVISSFPVRPVWS